MNFKEAVIREFVFHKISRNENLNQLNSHLINFELEEDEILKHIFLSPFQNNIITYEFFHEINLDLNTLYKLSQSIYDSEEEFIEVSKKIHTHLKAVSKHPNIKDGDLFIIRFTDIRLGDRYCDALGIYKVENKGSFLEVYKDSVAIKQGINNQKIDKACLILFTDSPYTVYVRDSNSKETEYWINDFVKANNKNDNINSTNELINLTKQFVGEYMPKDSNFSKVDRIDLLNKSMKYLKEKDEFELEEFSNQVVSNYNLKDDFISYKEDYEKQANLSINDRFDISSNVVRRQLRSLKNVIKLDNNFQIHVQGDRDLLEQGKDNKGKYYKIYYDIEH